MRWATGAATAVPCWDEIREAEELVDYFKLVERARGFRAEIGRGSREVTI